ncbi:MAG TPA: imidazole glycerol phosphate synthase subunit HisF, partial [Tepidisphaeraceae bacterium]|nr:imidazole glycerol phosphate synthase subunit HisF [Tepidisphaeraceae bacterium]
RIIPCLDVDRGRVVKGVKFFDHVDAGDPVEQAKRYQEQGADELVFYDITASHEGRGIMTDVVRRVVEQCFMPLTVGGGIRTLDDATQLIQAGAEKVSINSAGVRRPELLAEISRKFGTCATVLGLDANRVVREKREARSGKREEEGGLVARREWVDERGVAMEEVWEVFVNGGRVGTGVDVVWWAREAERLGAGEIVLNVMNADGTTAGYDLEMTAAVSGAVHVPVVASGGAGSPEHMYKVLSEGKADAALAASIFHFGSYTVGQVKEYLGERGVAVRVV